MPIAWVLLNAALLQRVPGLALLETAHEASAKIHVLASQELLLTQSLLLLHIPVEQYLFLLLEEVDGASIFCHTTHLSVQQTV